MVEYLVKRELLQVYAYEVDNRGWYSNSVLPVSLASKWGIETLFFPLLKIDGCMFGKVSIVESLDL